MSTLDAAALHRGLARANVDVEAGLSPDEFERIETTWGFEFPPDLRAFLGAGVPVAGRWVAWRTVDGDQLQQRMSAPWEGVAFDIEHNGCWLSAWGSKPDTLGERLAVARQIIDAAPTLIPVYGHRYLPASPKLPGNPVFSVHQTDIIVYGVDLADYLANEFPSAFGRPGGLVLPATTQTRIIPCWSEFVD